MIASAQFLVRHSRGAVKCAQTKCHKYEEVHVELNDEIIVARTADAISQVCCARLTEFNSVNILTGAPVVPRKLTEAFALSLCVIDAQGLRQSVWPLGKLVRSDERPVGQTQERSRAHLHGFDCLDTSTLLWSHSELTKVDVFSVDAAVVKSTYLTGHRKELDSRDKQIHMRNVAQPSSRWYA